MALGVQDEQDPKKRCIDRPENLVLVCHAAESLLAPPYQQISFCELEQVIAEWTRGIGWEIGDFLLREEFLNDVLETALYPNALLALDDLAVEDGYKSKDNAGIDFSLQQSFFSRALVNFVGNVTGFGTENEVHEQE